MKIYVGVTDNNWFNHLKCLRPDEVNFWQPNNTRNFRALEQGELFLFKLHSPYNYIAGGGIFVSHSFLPASLAWDIFGQNNGTANREQFIDSIYKYRKTDRMKEPDPVIGNLILNSPFFFNEDEYIPLPESWALNIVQGKTYDTKTDEGRHLYNNVQNRFSKYSNDMFESQRYGKPQIMIPRLGQGSFKVAVTQAYHRRCAITGEKTLPVLNASHIKPFSKNGPNVISNGLLLRQDVHTLFDRGYITINENNIIEVSRRIREDYGNGREYYTLHGKMLNSLPDDDFNRPSGQFLLWHNENIYIG